MSTVQSCLLLALCATAVFAASNNSSKTDPSHKCPKDNEAYHLCSRSCEETCHNPNPTDCPATCGPPKCQCVAGYVRNTEGKCVTLPTCGNQTCSDNEVWNTCGNCEATCADLFPECSKKENCTPGKCICKPGLYRNYEGKCVDLRQCSEENEPCKDFVCLKGTACVNYRPKCLKPPCFVQALCVKRGCLRN